ANALHTHGDPLRRTLCRQVHYSICIDPEKCICLDDDELVDLPALLVAIVPAADVYIVRLYLTAEADLLVTTDTPLHDALTPSPEVNIQLRDAFLVQYL